MRITFAPRGILQIDDARIIYRNFAGEASQFNRAGDRNFSLFIGDEDLAMELRDRGWNVKEKVSRDNPDELWWHLPVKVKFNDRGPQVYLKSGGRVNNLDEESVSMLDDIDILGVDLDIRPYDWEVSGKTGRTAYLQSIHVTQNLDRFAARYDEDDRF